MGVKFVPELMRIGTHTYCPKLERINCKSGNSIVGNETDTLPKVILLKYYKNSNESYNFVFVGQIGWSGQF